MKHFLLPLALATGPILGQTSGTPPCQAQLQLVQEGALLRVTGSCRSHLDRAARYHYELRAQRRNASGQSRTTQRGSFELPAQQQVLLSQVGLSAGANDHYHIHLLVYDDTGRAVAQDSARR